MDKTNNLDIFMTDLADSIREATGETGSINAQSFSTRITGLGTGKQDKLVSGENIKTINGESILGSGDIEISGKVSVITQTSSGIEALQPNVITIITKPLAGIYIDDFVISSSLHDEYTVIFSTGGLEPEAPSITLPDYVLWANGSVPTLEWHTVYEFSITRDFLTIVPEGGLNEVEQNVYKAVLTPFKAV